MSCTPQGPVIYSNSPWIGAANPIIYKVNSCKWPINTFDDVESYHSVINNNGFVQLQVNFTYNSYVRLDQLTITGNLYEGIYAVKSVEGPNKITIDAPYRGDDSGTLQKYYQNYRVRVRVYTGRQVPMVVNTMAVQGITEGVPDPNGDAYIDVSDLVRAALGSPSNELCDSLNDNSDGISTNDTNMWTQFYIEVQEVFSSSNGNNLSDFFSDWVRDDDEGGDINYYFCTHGGHQVNDPDGRSFGRYDIGQVDSGEPKAQFLTFFDEPTYFLGEEFDLQILSSVGDNTGLGYEYFIREYDDGNNLLSTTSNDLVNSYEGVYRFSFSDFSFNSNTKYFDFWIQKTGLVLSEVKRVNIDRSTCGNKHDRLYLRWLNTLGGWEAWEFRGRKSASTQVERKIGRRNIYANWDTDFINTPGQRFVASIQAGRMHMAYSDWLTDQQREALVEMFESIEVISQVQDTTGDCNNMIHKTIIIVDSDYEYRTGRIAPNEIRFRYEESSYRVTPTQ